MWSPRGDQKGYIAPSAPEIGRAAAAPRRVELGKDQRVLLDEVVKGIGGQCDDIGIGIGNFSGL